MRNEKRERRMREIETEAYALFTELGFEKTSMLAVAKRAKASNETLYRWYGDKNGLFESMVRANAAHVRDTLNKAARAGGRPLDTVTVVAGTLLKMLLSDRAIILNRAAARDSTGDLGRLLSQAGREDILPLIQEMLLRSVKAGAFGWPETGDMGTLFVNLLVGDQQIRRVIGVLDAPSSAEIDTQVARALAQLQVLCPPQPEELP